MPGKVLLIPDHFCVVSDHEKFEMTYVVLTDIMPVQQHICICTYSTRKYKVSESNSSYSVLLQYKFTLLYCVLLRGRSNGPHKEDWPDKRKRS